MIFIPSLLAKSFIIEWPELLIQRVPLDIDVVIRIDDHEEDLRHVELEAKTSVFQDFLHRLDSAMRSAKV